MKRLFLVLIVIFFSLDQHPCFAQRFKIDSLQTLLKTDQEDTSKVNHLNALSFEFHSNKSSDTAMALAKSALQLSNSLTIGDERGWSKGIAVAIFNIGQGFEDKHDYAEAKKYYLSAIKPAEKAGDKKLMGVCYHYAAVIDMNQGNYTEALSAYFSALKLRKEIGDKKGIAGTYNNIGIVYKRLGDYGKALENYVAALKIKEEIGDKKGIASSCLNIGNIIREQHDEKKAMEYFSRALKLGQELGDKRIMASAYTNFGANYETQDSLAKALEYYLSALRLNEEDNYLKGIPDSHNQIGRLYMKLGHYGQALEHYLAALKLSAQIDDKQSLSSEYNNLGALYLKQGKIEEAKKQTLAGLNIAKQIGAKSDLETAYETLSRSDSASGNWKEAYLYHKLYKQLHDSIFNEESTKKTAQINAGFESEKKETQIKLLEKEKENQANLSLAENKKQKIILWSVLGGLLLVLVFSGFMYNRFRVTKKQKNTIAEQRDLMQQQKELAEELRERAEQSEKFQQRFLANMSHEIRTPMNAVMGMTNLALDTPHRERQNFYLEGIKKSSDTLLHIINDILDLSKIEAGKMELEKIDFSLGDVVAQVKQTLNHKAEEKGLELLVDIDHSISDVVVGDPVRLNQVLINLAGNAIKFTEKGSVTIDVSKAEAGLKFSVIDTGIGIPQDKLQTVFENFSQANTSDTRKYGGTGLGLSISRQLVELMGGAISITSREGSGTTFSFTVNFENGSAERLEQRLASEREVDGSILNGLRILIVDDNEYNRIVAKDTLESKSSVEVTSSESAHDAIGLLKERSFDVVLMDVQMPLMNGFEATRYIRENFEAPLKDIPIIALTASVLRTDLDKCRDAGMNFYIPKPFKASQLVTGIAQVLNIKLKTEKKKEPVKIVQASHTLGVTNLDYLSNFCAGDPVKMKKYIGMFTASAPSLIEKIHSALEQNDFEEIANQVHGFKTKWMMMGMNETKDLALKIEKQCREKTGDDSRTENISRLIDKVKIAISELG